MAQKGTQRPLGPLGCMERHLEVSGLHRKALRGPLVKHKSMCSPLGLTERHLEASGVQRKAPRDHLVKHKGTPRPLAQTERNSELPGQQRKGLGGHWAELSVQPRGLRWPFCVALGHLSAFLFEPRASVSFFLLPSDLCVLFY